MKINTNTKRLILFVLMLFLQTSLVAQNEQYEEEDDDDGYYKYWLSADAGYGIGIDRYKNRVTHFGDRQFCDLRIKTGYHPTPRFSYGLGFGLHLSPIENTIPLMFLDFRFHLIDSHPQLFAYTDIGVSYEARENIIHAFFSDAGLGYRIRLKKFTSLNLLLGYNLLGYWVEKDLHRRHSVIFRLAFEIHR